ncbi:SLC13 family permease [Methanorbis rubei]|uniref:Transporter n=1 Tax=Methanorbis rubei TaxID=3028300 RepID=A0AAE4SBR0_9EURY|nr:putative transporter [Methanocorpusculaceae archaeon Cs1]
MFPVAVAILAVVFVLIVVRRVGRVRLPIWVVMTGGAVAALLTGSISIPDAVASVNVQLIVFLFGVFVLGVAMERSGLLHTTSVSVFSKAKTRRQVMLWFIFLMAGTSAFLMNDTVAIIGTPVALYCARHFDIPVTRMLVALAAAVTFGSVMTPIGNPQVLLIAMSGGIPDSFVNFFIYLFVPAMVSLYVLYRLMIWRLPNGEALLKVGPDTKEPEDLKLEWLVKLSLVLMFVVIGLRVVTSMLGYELPMVAIAAAAALPLLIFSKRRAELVRGIDWSTLVFFVSMFVLMAAVWNTGVIQSFLPESFTTSMPMLFVVSLLVPQLVSNVPYVALVLPVLEAAGAPMSMYLTLAAGSTVSGGLTILGAASSVIIIQNAEKRGQTMTFWQYFRIGVPLTIVSATVFILWIWMMSSL